jgi:hypothetical protein
MTPIRPIGNAHDFEAPEIRLPNFEISWAGEGPWNQCLCFGSEDGRFAFKKIDDPTAYYSPNSVVESSEAINGISFINEQMAVSTRNEVVFFRKVPFGDQNSEPKTYEGGAHHVIATSSGRFVAPLGPNGVLFKEPDQSVFQKLRVFKAAGKEFNFYRIVGLGPTDRGDVLACAMRRDGIATTVLSVPEGTGSIEDPRTYPGLDVVDICSLKSEEFPFAAVTLGIDRSLHLFRNVLNDQSPATLQIKGLEGTAYRVLSAQGHIFLLTSQSLYTFNGLASRFLSGREIGGPLTIPGLDFQAVDANLAFGRWLLVIMPDKVISIDIDHLVALDEGVSTSAKPANGVVGTYDVTLMQSSWEVHSGHELSLSV